MPLRRSSINAPRANRGRFAEQLLASTHAHYAAQGVAVMTAVPPPVGRLHRRTERARPGHFEGWYKTRTVADYLGAVLPDGRALALELKSTTESRWYLSQVEEHQAEFLHRWATVGALAYVLVVFLTDSLIPDAAILNWPAFHAELREHGRNDRGFTWDSLAREFRSATAVATDGVPPLDYLPAIRRIEAQLAGPRSTPRT
jgi:penicillin-binding protein-related factor A (putative recombinase)